MQYFKTDSGNLEIGNPSDLDLEGPQIRISPASALAKPPVGERPLAEFDRAAIRIRPIGSVA